MKKAIISLLTLLLVLSAYGQDDIFIFDMPDDFAKLDTTAQTRRFKSIP